MRKLLTVIFLLLSFTIYAQVPQGFNYQAVIRNTNGDIIQEQDVSVRITILQGNTSGSPVYTETNSTQSNTFGLINLIIGQGDSSDDFATIDWSNFPYYLKIEIDLNDGSGYTELGTSQLLSVPFAMYSSNTDNSDDADADPTNELQVLSISNDTIYLSQGSFVKLPAASVPQQMSVSDFGDTLFLSNGNSIIIPGISSSNYPQKFGCTWEGQVYNSGITADDKLLLLGGKNDSIYSFQKVDTCGNNIWNKEYTLKNVMNGGLTDVSLTSNGSFIYTVNYQDESWKTSSVIGKLDSNGDTIWTSNFTESTSLTLHKAIELNDNNFLTTGSYEDDDCSPYCLIPFVAKLDQNGTLIWSKTYSMSFDFINKRNVLSASDGSIYISGLNNGILKLANNGDSIWFTNNFGEETTMYSINAIKESSDNNFYVAGGRILFKMNSDGDTIWTKYPNIDIDEIITDSEDNIFAISSNDIPGFKEKFGADDIIITKFNSDGEIINQKAYGGSRDEWIHHFFKLSNDRFLIVAKTESYDGCIPEYSSTEESVVWVFTIP